MHQKFTFFIFLVLVMFPVSSLNFITQNQVYADTSSNSFSTSSGSTTSNQPGYYSTGTSTTQPYVTFSSFKLDSNIVPNKPFKVSVGVTTTNPSSSIVLSLSVPPGISILSDSIPTFTYTKNANERAASWTLLAARAGVYDITINSYSTVPYETDTYTFSAPVGSLNSLIVTGVDIPGNIFPSDTFTVGLKLKNSGNLPDTLVRSQITVPTGLQLLDQVSSPSISLNTTEEKEFFWKIQAQSSGSFPLVFDYSSANSGDNKINATVNVGSVGVSDVIASKIYLGGFDSRSNHVGPGDKNVPLVVLLTNTGTSTLYNIEGVLPLGNPFSSDTSQIVQGQSPSLAYNVGQLAPGSSANMTYFVDIKNPTASQTYVNKLKVSFFDGKQQEVKLLDIPVTISNGVLLSITAHKSSIFANVVTPLTLEIKNSGSVAVHNLKITSTYGTQFTSVDTPIWVGDVATGETKESVLKIISSNNTSSQYPIPILVSYDADGQTYTASYQVSAQSSASSDFFVQSVTVNPNQSYPGDVAKSISVQLLNAGLADSNNATVSLILPDGFTPAWGNATSSFLGRVMAQSVSTATFYVNVGNNVTTGNYPFTVIVKDDKQTKQLNINFIVAQKAIFKIVNIDASQLYPGASNALFTVTLQNIGSDTAQTVTTTLLTGNTVPGVKSFDITTVGNQENVGNVLPNQVFTTSFIVNVDPDAAPGDKQQSIQINWVNPGNISFVQSLQLPYHLANGPGYLLYVGQIPITYVVIAIGLVIALSIFFKQRRSRIKDMEVAWSPEIQLGNVTDSPQLNVMENQTVLEQKEIIDDIKTPANQNYNVEHKENVPLEIDKNKVPLSDTANRYEFQDKKHNSQVNVPLEIDKNKGATLSDTANRYEFQDEEDNSLFEIVTKVLASLNGTHNAIGLDANQKEIFNVPLKKVIKNLRSSSSETRYLILNGEISEQLVDEAILEGIKYIVGRHKNNIKEPNGLTIKTFEDLGITKF